MFMNESDIEEAIEVIGRRHPEILPYALYLRDWKDIINGNSDGWPYWGHRSAGKLMELLDQTVGAIRQWGAYRGTTIPDVKNFKRTLGPIKAFATKHKLPVPELRPVQEQMF